MNSVSESGVTAGRPAGGVLALHTRPQSPSVSRPMQGRSLSELAGKASGRPAGRGRSTAQQPSMHIES